MINKLISLEINLELENKIYNLETSIFDQWQKIDQYSGDEAGLIAIHQRLLKDIKLFINYSPVWDMNMKILTDQITYLEDWLSKRSGK